MLGAVLNSRTAMHSEMFERMAKNYSCVAGAPGVPVSARPEAETFGM